MIKKLLSLLLLIFALSGVGFAQSSNADNSNSGVSTSQNTSSVSVTATASIIIYRGLTITNIKGIDFGNVVAGVGTVSITSNDAKAAEFEVTGEPSSSVKVTFQNTSVPLTSGKNSLSMNLFKPIYDVSDNQGSANEATDNGLFTTQLGIKGNLFLWVGGKVNVPATTPSGTYTGTLGVSVTYTND